MTHGEYNTTDCAKRLSADKFSSYEKFFFLLKALNDNIQFVRSYFTVHYLVTYNCLTNDPNTVLYHQFITIIGINVLVSIPAAILDNYRVKIIC